MSARPETTEPEVCLSRSAGGEQEEETREQAQQRQEVKHQDGQEHGKEQQKPSLHIVPQMHPTPDEDCPLGEVGHPSRFPFKYSTDDDSVADPISTSCSILSQPSSTSASCSSSSQSPVSPSSPLLQTPTTPALAQLSPPLAPSKGDSAALATQSFAVGSPSGVTSPETLVRSFSCELPRPLPPASTAPTSVLSRVRYPSPLRQATYPQVGHSSSSPMLRSAASLDMTPSLSSASTGSGSSGSTTSLSNLGLGGSLDLPRPILRHHHSHSVVRTSSPLRQQVGFDNEMKAPVVPKSALANSTARTRQGRAGTKVAWAQTVHAGMESSILDLDLHASSTLPNRQKGSLSRPATARPSTFHESSHGMERSIRAKPALRHQPSLSSRALPGNRPASAPNSGLWSEAPDDQPPLNHPSTALPGFPAVEFSDLRAPKFSRAGLRNGNVIMPVAAPRSSRSSTTVRPVSTVRPSSTVRPASTVVVDEPKVEKENKASSLSGMVRKLSRRVASTPSLREKAAEQAKSTPPPLPASPMPSGSIRHRRTPALHNSISHDALGPLQREHLPARGSSNQHTSGASAQFRPAGAPPMPQRPRVPYPTSMPLPALGPQSAPPPPDVFRHLPPGCGLPSYDPPPPRPMPHRGQSIPGPPQHVQRQPVAYGPPRAAPAPPPLRHYRSAPGLRPVPLEPLPELSPTSPPITPASPRQHLAPMPSRSPRQPVQQMFGPLPHPPLSPTTLNRPARIPAFDDYEPYVPQQRARPPYRSYASEGEPRQQIGPVRSKISDTSPVLSLSALPALPSLPSFADFGRSSLNVTLGPTNDANGGNDFTLPDLPGGAVEEPTTPTGTTFHAVSPPQVTPTRPARCASAVDPDALTVPAGQKLSFSAPPTPGIGSHYAALPDVAQADGSRTTPRKHAKGDMDQSSIDTEMQPRPSDASFDSASRAAPSIFVAAGRSINRTRSPSSLSLCSEASLHSTASSGRSISSLTSASSAASVDMPDPIAEDEDDAEDAVKVASGSTAPSVDSHASSLESPRLTAVTDGPLPSPTQGAIIKSGVRAQAAVAHRMQVQ